MAAPAYPNLCPVGQKYLLDVYNDLSIKSGYVEYNFGVAYPQITRIYSVNGYGGYCASGDATGGYRDIRRTSNVALNAAKDYSFEMLVRVVGGYKNAPDGGRMTNASVGRNTNQPYCDIRSLKDGFYYGSTYNSIWIYHYPINNGVNVPILSGGFYIKDQSNIGVDNTITEGEGQWHTVRYVKTTVSPTVGNIAIYFDGTRVAYFTNVNLDSVTFGTTGGITYVGVSKYVMYCTLANPFLINYLYVVGEFIPNIAELINCGGSIQPDFIADDTTPLVRQGVQFTDTSLVG